MENKGFLEELVEDVCRNIEFKRAIEFSRDANGKVDKMKATGILMGKGYTSDRDMAILAGMLGAEGAFDD